MATGDPENPAQPVPPVPVESENATPPLPAPGPGGTPPEPHEVTLNAGLLLPVRLVDGHSSLERGARVEDRVVASAPSGKLKGGAAIGAGDVIPTRGKPATLSSETRISFRLGAPLAFTGRL